MLGAPTGWWRSRPRSPRTSSGGCGGPSRSSRTASTRRSRSATARPCSTPARHSLVHTGRLNVVGRSPQRAVRRAARVPAPAPRRGRRLEVVFAGPIAPDQERLLADPAPARARALGRQPRAPGGARPPAPRGHAARPRRGQRRRPARSVATGKLFEYLGRGRPVLVLGEDSEAARIVAGADAGAAARGELRGGHRRDAGAPRGRRDRERDAGRRAVRVARARRALRASSWTPCWPSPRARSAAAAAGPCARAA